MDWDEIRRRKGHTQSDDGDVGVGPVRHRPPIEIVGPRKEGCAFALLRQQGRLDKREVLARCGLEDCCDSGAWGAKEKGHWGAVDRTQRACDNTHVGLGC